MKEPGDIHARRDVFLLENRVVEGLCILSLLTKFGLEHLAAAILHPQSLWGLPPPPNDRDFFFLFSLFIFLNHLFDFLPFSSNLVANHTHISSITPPCYLDPPHTPHPWRPQLGSSDPESDTPSPIRILSPVCRNSRCPRRF